MADPNKTIPRSHCPGFNRNSIPIEESYPHHPQSKLVFVYYRGQCYSSDLEGILPIPSVDDTLPKG